MWIEWTIATRFLREGRAQSTLILVPVSHQQVMHTPSIRRTGHPQFAPGIGSQHIGDHLAILHKGFGISGQAIAIEAGTGQPLQQMRIFLQSQPLWKQLLAKGTFEK